MTAGTGRAPSAAHDLGPTEAARRVLRALEEGHRAVEFLVPPPEATEGTEGGRVGRVVFVDAADGLTRLGAFDDPALENAAAAHAADLLAGRTRPGPWRDLYVEVHAPPSELVIVGAGHIAVPLARAAHLLGYRVVVADDRPGHATFERFPDAARVVRVDFADPFADLPLARHSHLVLVTRGHRYDYECLRRVLLADRRPAYIGMIGSRRRVRATLEALRREGIPRDRLATLHAPIGLDIGAQTPEEIAVSVAAELVLASRGGTGRPLGEVERVLERWIDGEAP